MSRNFRSWQQHTALFKQNWEEDPNFPHFSSSILIHCLIFFRLSLNDHAINQSQSLLLLFISSPPLMELRIATYLCIIIICFCSPVAAPLAGRQVYESDLWRFLPSLDLFA